MSTELEDLYKEKGKLLDYIKAEKAKKDAVELKRQQQQDPLSLMSLPVKREKVLMADEEVNIAASSV
jgi:hypothetical protein